jgi:DNA replication licensing factor MCM4
LDDHLLSSLGHEEDVGMRGDESGSVMPDKVRVIWGTNIVIQQTIQQFKDFLLHFTPAHLQLSGTSPIEAASRSFNSEDTEEVASKWTPYYPTVLRRLYETQRPYLDLDCRHLLAYRGTQTLYTQLCRYPQEMIPLMDVTATDVFWQIVAPQLNLADMSGRDTWGIQVRPFGLSETVNLRDMSPADVDQLVQVKG